jgi:transglutaminase-like putative cysteine protease
MLIQSEFDIQFRLSHPTAMVALLHLHPSLNQAVKSGNELAIEKIAEPSPDGGPGTPLPTPDIVPSTEYHDTFGNRCTRFVAPAGTLRLRASAITLDDGLPDQIEAHATQAPVEDLPDEVLQFLLPSRYCEVDRFVAIAQDLFGWMTPGWTKASAIRDWVHEKVAFNYKTARPTKTAMDVYTERIGVCRDFQHLAITLSRCQNIPARYVTGYLGDINHPYSGAGDFSAWYEVFLDGRWMTMDARHNDSRYGRVLMAAGRDAADVAITTSFGDAYLAHFYVDSFEVDESGFKLPIPGAPPATVASSEL